jgi:hypothetical protein
LELYVASVADRKSFNNYARTGKLKKAYMKSDESWALLAIENSHKHWLVVCLMGQKEALKKENRVPMEYTGLQSDGKKMVGSSARGEGWSQKGMKRFKELTKIVEARRNSRPYREFAKWYMEELGEKEDESGSTEAKKARLKEERERKKRQKERELESYIVVDSDEEKDDDQDEDDEDMFGSQPRDSLLGEPTREEMV